MSCSSTKTKLLPGIVGENLAHGSEDVSTAVYNQHVASIKLASQGTQAHYGGKRSRHRTRKRRRLKGLKKARKPARRKSRRLRRRRSRFTRARQRRYRSYRFRGGKSPCGSICGTGADHAVVISHHTTLKGTGNQSPTGNAAQIQETIAKSKCQALGDKA